MAKTRRQSVNKVRDADQLKPGVLWTTDGQEVFVPEVIIPHAVSWVAFFSSLYVASYYNLLN